MTATSQPPPQPHSFDPATRERLERELAGLQADRRRLAADLVDEQPVGDRGDAALLLDWADELTRIDNRIAELTGLLSGRSVESSVREGVGGLPDGTRVTLRFADGSVEELRVVRVTEEAGEAELDRVLTADSPLGRALAGGCSGDTVTYQTPGGQASVEILALRPPGAPSGAG